MEKRKKKNTWRICSFLLVFMAVGILFSRMNVNAATQTKKKKVLVVYFSVTGTTKGAAKKIKKATNGTLYQIKAKNPYTKEDINYNYEQCRANVEQNNGKVRPEIKGKIKGIRKYDVIFVGYPIWWGKEPMIIRTFLESYNLKGKKIVPFCTSGGSGISGSMAEIKASAKGAKKKKGRDLTDASQKEVKSWAKKISNK